MSRRGGSRRHGLALLRGRARSERTGALERRKEHANKTARARASTTRLLRGRRRGTSRVVLDKSHLGAINCSASHGTNAAHRFKRAHTQVNESQCDEQWCAAEAGDTVHRNCFLGLVGTGARGEGSV